MADTEINSAAGPQPAASRSAARIIFASATEAFGSAILLWCVGGVAISIAGSVAGDMVPSLPPAFGGPQPSGTHDSGHHYEGWHAVREYSFVIVFAIFFIHSLWVGFHEGGSRARRRLMRIVAKLRKHWFGLIVGNAFSAWFAVLMLDIVQAFSPWQILWNCVWGVVVHLVAEIGHLVFGAWVTGGLGGWFSWYGENHNKLVFWIIYLGGAFDDLGVPNFKTLARWAWRRFQKRKETALPATVTREDAA